MINDEKFSELAEFRSDNPPCVSIYIPTHRAGKNQEDNLRFKNALKEAKHELQERGLNEKDARQYLEEGYKLLEDADFWLHLSDGLSAYFGPDYFHYDISPVTYDQLVFLGDRFHTRHLIPGRQNQNRFFILAISAKMVKFFEAHKYSITPVKIDDLVPESLKKVLEVEVPEKSVQYHFGQGAAMKPIYHGHGLPKDTEEAEMREYLRMVNDGLMKMLHDEKSPMIVAAVESLTSIYRDLNSYPHLVDEQVTGNPEEWDPVLLHEKAWFKIEDHFSQDLEQKKQAFGDKLPKEEASSYLYDIVPAAVAGRIDTLFVNKNEREWGVYDEEKHSITLHKERQPDSLDLLDLAATKVFLQDGEVFEIERDHMPHPTANANAVYRF